MTTTLKRAGIGAVALLTLSALAGCSAIAAPAPTRDEQLAQSQDNFDSRTPPDVSGDAEYQNYMRAQEDVYDNPATILWCTASFNAATSPLFTVPIAGKLTSSSVSYFPNQHLEDADMGEYYGQTLVESQSVDGMYHGSPGPYRYGFTPGGQYVDFTNMAVFCTTALTEFQRVSLTSTPDTEADKATKKAEALLEEAQTAYEAGDTATYEAKQAEAQAILDALAAE